jgi:hypothetical protein
MSLGREAGLVGDRLMAGPVIHSPKLVARQDTRLWLP